MCAKLLQLCPTPCDPMDCSSPGSSVHEILQARMLEWVALPSYRRYSKPRDGTHISYISCIGRQILHHWAICKALTLLLSYSVLQMIGQISFYIYILGPSQVTLVVNNLPANAGESREAGWIPEEGHGNPLQHSCLENLMDRGAWWVMVHGVT